MPMTGGTTCTISTLQAPPQQPQGAQAKPMPPVQRQLVYSAHAVAVVNPTSTDTIEQVLMNIVLMNMYYDTNSLRGQDLKNTTIPNSYSHKSQVRYTLELCQYLMTDSSELASFQNWSFANHEDSFHMLHLKFKIQCHSFGKLYEHAGSRAKKPTYGAVGTCVHKYKKSLPCDQELQKHSTGESPQPTTTNECKQAQWTL